MKRLIALSAVIGLLTAGAPTVQAASPVVQETIPVQSAFQSATVTDPCNGELITWTGNVHLVGAMTTDANGGAVFLAQFNFEDVQGTDPTGIHYTFALASNQSVVFAPSSPNLGSTPNLVTDVLRFDIIGDGSTPKFYEYEVLHLTITPDGRITVAFDNVNTGSCSS